MDKNNCPECNHCNKIVTITQITGTCWFNSLLMCIFYSDSMKNILLDKKKKWEFDGNLKRIFTKMIKKKYTSVSYDIPDYILMKLFNENEKIFNFNPRKQTGYNSLWYLQKFLNYLSIENLLMLDCHKNNLYYSFYHNNYKITSLSKEKIIPVFELDEKKESYKPENENADVIAIIYDYDYNNIHISTNTTNLYLSDFSLSEHIIHNGETYKLDSLLLTNFNFDTCYKSHMICGITCNGKRYIYNGWIKHMIPEYSSCSLIEYDWLNTNGHFCLNTDECKINTENSKDELCFNIKMGLRTYLYVKITNKNINNNINNENNNDYKNDILLNDIDNYDPRYQEKQLNGSIWMDVRDLNVELVKNKLKDKTFTIPHDIKDENFKGNLFTALSINYKENMSISIYQKMNAICTLLSDYNFDERNGGLFPDILIKHLSEYDEQLLEIFKYSSIYGPLNTIYKFKQNYDKNKSKECALTICLKMGDIRIIQIFFKIYKYRINDKYKDSYGNNMLHIVSSRKNKDKILEIVKFIIDKYPFYVNDKNKFDKTPYDLSVENNNKIPFEIYFNDKTNDKIKNTVKIKNTGSLKKKNFFLTSSLSKIRDKIPFFKKKNNKKRTYSIQNNIKNKDNNLHRKDNLSKNNSSKKYQDQIQDNIKFNKNIKDNNLNILSRNNVNNNTSKKDVKVRSNTNNISKNNAIEDNIKINKNVKDDNLNILSRNNVKDNVNNNISKKDVNVRSNTNNISKNNAIKDNIKINKNVKDYNLNILSRNNVKDDKNNNTSKKNINVRSNKNNDINNTIKDNIQINNFSRNNLNVKDNNLNILSRNNVKNNTNVNNKSRDYLFQDNVKNKKNNKDNINNLMINNNVKNKKNDNSKNKEIKNNSTKDNNISKKYINNEKDDHAIFSDYLLQEVFHISNKDKIFKSIDDLVNTSGRKNQECKIYITRSNGFKFVFTVFRPISPYDSYTPTYVSLESSNYSCYFTDTYLKAIDKIMKNDDKIYVEPGSTPEMIHGIPVLPSGKYFKNGIEFEQAIKLIVKKYENNLENSNIKKENLLQEVWNDSDKETILKSIDDLVNTIGKNNNNCIIHIIRSYGVKIVFTVFRPISPYDSYTPTYVSLESTNYSCYFTNTYLKAIEKFVKTGDKIYVKLGSTPEMIHGIPVLPSGKHFKNGIEFEQAIKLIIKKYENNLSENNKKKINYFLEIWNISNKKKIFKSIDDAIRTMGKKNKECKIHITRSNGFNIVFTVFRSYNPSISYTPIYIELESKKYICYLIDMFFSAIEKIARNGDKICIKPGSISKMPSEKILKKTGLQFDEAVDFIIKINKNTLF